MLLFFYNISSVTYIISACFYSYAVYNRPELKYLENHVRDHLCAACEDNPEAWKDFGMELLPVGALLKMGSSSIPYIGSSGNTWLLVTP